MIYSDLQPAGDLAPLFVILRGNFRTGPVKVAPEHKRLVRQETNGLRSGCALGKQSEVSEFN